MSDPFPDLTGVERLSAVVSRLRGPGGCPWDIEQTHESLLPGLIEECYELVDAVREHDEENFREELGDLLLQVVMHSRMAEEEGRFDLARVAGETADKLIRRHPHVFGGTELADSEAVLKQWDVIKAGENKGRQSALDGVPSALPSLARAQKVGKKAARAGFDWDSADQVLAKVREETEELERAMAGDCGVEEELGDLLFAVTNLARKRGIDAELSLRGAAAKFERRFRAMELRAAQAGQSLSDMTAAAQDALWEDIKARESR